MDTKKIGGLSASKAIWPVIIILALLNVSIVFLMVSISSASGELSKGMSSSGEYTSDASSLLAASSLLSETSRNFILMPVTKDGEFNINPLAAYNRELGSERMPDKVNSRFKHYDVTEAEKKTVAEAADCAKRMMDSQSHALALIDAVYPFPDNPNLKKIKLAKLSKQEKAWPAEKKLGTARTLVLGEEYNLNKQTVSECINEVMRSIKEDASVKAAATQQKIGTFHTLLWVFAILIIAIMVFTFMLIFTGMINPLQRFVKVIDSSNALEENKGLKEVRTLAAAYNRLLRRRDALDTILKSAAETDTLTNLPNRYSFEQYLFESDDKDSLAIVLFDVNFLKKTNDQYGHAAGDELLKKCAKCILSVFGSSEDKRCFRFGGDEFAAVIKDTTVQDIELMIARFESNQEKYDISIACGYSFTDDIKKTTVKDLLNDADKAMYRSKNEMHKRDGR